MLKSINAHQVPTILDGAREVLQHGNLLLTALDDATYIARVPAAFQATVGAHYRHCLEHFSMLLQALAGGEINYDLRQRDLRLETERAFAQSETLRLLLACEALPETSLESSILVRGKVGYAGSETLSAPSTVGRELMYAVSHAIHHYALIGVMCGILGVALPPNFGVAPSTVQHRQVLAS